MIESAIALAGILALVGGGYLWGYFQDSKAREEAVRLAEEAQLKTEAKTREAEILARPAGDKRDIIGRL